MTKQEELDTLKLFISTLPEASYIRPMLEKSLPMIQSDMVSDVEPDLASFRIQLKKDVENLEKNAKFLDEKIREQNNLIRGNTAKLKFLTEDINRFQEKAKEQLKSILSW